MVTLSNWRARMGEDMQLRDLRSRTREGYGFAVRQFVEHVRREPRTYTEEDVRAYMLHLRCERRLAPTTVNLAVCALRFFFKHTLKRNWRVFDLLRVKIPRSLPAVLSRGEVRSVLGAVTHPVKRMALTTIYALGLRIGEGLSLDTAHIDGDRLLVSVRNGKGRWTGACLCRGLCWRASATTGRWNARRLHPNTCSSAGEDGRRCTKRRCR